MSRRPCRSALPATAGVFPLRSFRLAGRHGGAAGALLFLAALSACSSANAPPGAVTRDEAQQLNDAAAMLDANSVDLNAMDDNAMDDVVASSPPPLK